MKNFFSTVRQSGPLKTKLRQFVTPNMVDTEGKVQLMVLMNLLSEVKQGRLKGLNLHERYHDKVSGAEIKFYEPAVLGDELFIESCFAPGEKKSVDLKIYISAQTPGEPARRVCRAKYTVGISVKPIATAV